MKTAAIGLALSVCAVAGAAAAQSPATAPGGGDVCNSINPSVVRDCVGRRIQGKERSLAMLYPRALAQVRRGFAEWGRSDKRMHPRFFEQAHKDWRRFVESNCTATAAFGGGSNSSVSDRETNCHEQELDRRIDLYRRMADGTFQL